MSSARDPLLETVRAYQAGCAEFNRISGDDANCWAGFEAVTFGPALARLQQWEGPAASMEGAIAALQISLLDSGGVNGSEAQDRMVKAALGYLESVYTAPPAPSAPRSIYLLLSRYWAEYEAVTVAMAYTDTMEHDTPEREAAFARQFEAGDRLHTLALAICAFLPATPEVARYKAQFLETLAIGNGGSLAAEYAAALISSLPRLVLFESGRAAK